MKGKKILFLSLALLLPATVFVFLKIFGKNKFDVPMIYQDGVIDAPTSCNLEYNTPYVLSDSIVRKLNNEKASLLVVDFTAQGSAELQVARDEFKKDSVIIMPASAINFADVNFLRECVFLLKPPSTIVLVDKQNMIRGYYENNREEIDRLILELKIILNKY